MTTYETKGRMTYKDENGDNHIIYPVTKMDCIDDMPDVEKMIAESVATYMEENPIKTPVRGTDYWTDDDIATIKSYVDEAILGGAW